MYICHFSIETGKISKRDTYLFFVEKINGKNAWKKNPKN